MSGRQVALPHGGTGMQITLIRISQIVAATRRDLRQIGYARASARPSG